MKHIKIVLALLVVVVVFTGLVFVVESFTTPQIQERLTREANEAKFEVLPSLADAYDLTYVVPEFTEDYDWTGTSVLSAFYEEGHGYIYEAQFLGYQSQIRYMVGISEDGTTTGLKVLEQGDTPGLGAEIANPKNWEQFDGMSLNSALNGNIDGLAGATVTTDAWKTSLSKVVDFHLNTVLGFTYSDVTASVNVDGVTKAEEMKKDDTVLEVTYVVEFESQYSNGPNVYSVTFKVGEGIKSLEILEATDTDTFGGHIADPEFAEQFPGMSIEDALAGSYDDLGGATYPITLAAFEESFEELVTYHNVNYEGAVEVIYTYEDITDDVDITAVTDAQEVYIDGVFTEVIYTVEFMGYTSQPTIYEITFTVGEGIEMIEFTSTPDTPGLGAEIGAPAFTDQFLQMTIDDALSGAYDGVSGATVTSDAFTETFDALLAYHTVEYEGYEPETFEEMVARYKEEVSVKGGTLTDVTGDYDLTDSYITMLEEMTPDGESEASHLVISFTFPGYIDDIQAIVGINLDDNKLNGLRIVSENETNGIGDRIYEEDFLAQFDNLNILGAKYGVYDAIGGASQTTGAKLTAGFENIITWYETDYLGSGEELTEAEILQQRISAMYPDAFSIVNISSMYDLTTTDVEMAFEVSDLDGVKLGTVFIVECLGASYGGNPTYLEYVLAINDDNTFAGFQLYSQNETGNNPAQFETEEYAAQIIGLVVDELAYPVDQIDSQGGSTITNNAILTSLENVARFFVEEIKGEEFNRPDPMAVTNHEVFLSPAFPTADHFESVYLDYAYEGIIGNMFAAYDEFDTLLGYVYVFAAQGNGGNIWMSWGVDLAGNTVELAVLAHAETWESAPYSGGETLPEATLLTQYEGVPITYFISNDANVDDYAGVTVTTSGIEEACTTVAEYHQDNVGGGS